MQNKFNKSNKIFISTVLATSAVICSASAANFKPTLKVYADASPSIVTIENSSFSQSSSSPLNWQAISEATSSVVAKVVNTSAEKFEDNKDDYKISVNPGKVLTASASDENVFMINSENIAVSYGYKSNSFSLESNGYYVIEVPVKTQNDGWASVYLVDENNNFELKCENIISTSNYTTYKFYVATSSTQLNVNLQLYLGSKSNVSKNAVFFDEIKAYSYAESSFYSLYEQRNSNSASSVPAYTTYSWQEADNDQLTKLNEDGSNASAEGFTQKVYSLESGTIYPSGVISPTMGNMLDNNNALLLKNAESASVGVRYNNSLTFKQYDYVLYSFYVKTNTSSGGLTIKLVEKNKNNEFVTVGDAVNGFTTADADNKYNGWEKVSFAIKASAFENKNLYTEFWLGNNSSQAKGYAFVGKRTVESLTSEEYENLSTSNSLVKVDVDNLAEDGSSFNNHSFNNFDKVNDVNNVFVKPAELEKIDSLTNNYGVWNSTDSFASGIINTNSSVFNSANYPFTNPGLTPSQTHSDINTQTNNVLAIYQNSYAYQGYRTNEATLSSNSYYKISVYVKTQVYSSLTTGIDNANGGARFALTYNNVVFSEFNNVVANGEWVTLSTYVRTGLNEMNVSALLSLGNESVKCIGSAFFDDMMIETATETEFKNATNNNFVKVVDIQKDGFNLVYGNINGYGLYESKNWSTQQSSNESVSGVLDTSNINSAYGIVSPGLPENSQSTNVLYINNKVDLETSYSNTFAQTLKSGSYYKISVWAKTSGLSQSESNIVYEDEDNTKAYAYGANISIDKVEESFTALTNTEWKQFIFYVNSDTDIEFKLNLSLGSNNAPTSGFAYFADVTVESMEEDAFTSATASYAEDNMPNNIKLVKTAITDPEEETPEETGNDFDWSTFAIMLSTFITGTALVIAIVGTILRRINFNKFVKLKKKSNNYDRNKVKLKSVRRAEIENLVKEKLDELNSKLRTLEHTKAEQEQQLADVKANYLAFKSRKLTKEERKEFKVVRNTYYNAYNNLSNTIVDINLLKDNIAKIKSDKYILQEEYNLMLKQWREEKEALKIEKRNQKAKQKLTSKK